VSKTTIYRRWANKDALVLEALQQIKRPVASFDTGNFRADMMHFLRSLRVVLEEPLIQRVTFRLLGEIAGKREWAQQYFHEVMLVNFAGLQGMIERARARGELRADVDPLLVMNLIGGPLFYHLVVSLFLPNQGPFPVEQFVDLLWEGLKPREAQRD
jgi:AcrR family transcriptional regulator